jgi:streptogramin lyase
VRLGGAPGPIAADGRHVWAGDGTSRSLRELEAHPLRLVRTVSLPEFPYRLAAAAGRPFVANGFRGTIVRLGGRDGLRVFRPEPHAMGRVQLASAAGSLWAASQDGVLVRLDPVSLRRTATIAGVGTPEALAAGDGALWVAEATRDALLRVDPRQGKVARSVPIGGVAEEVAVGGGSVWALTPLENRLWRIDARTSGVTASIDVGPHGTALAAADGAVWVGSADASLSRVDPRRNAVVETVAVGGPVAGLAAAGDRVWVAIR